MHTAFEFLHGLRPAIPFSTENPCHIMTNGELKRIINQGGVWINGETCKVQELIDFPVFSIVFFPKGARKTTIW